MLVQPSKRSAVGGRHPQDMNGCACRHQVTDRPLKRIDAFTGQGGQDNNIIPPLRNLARSSGRFLIEEIEFVPCLDNKRRTITRSEEHTSELQSLMRISYAVFCLKKKNIDKNYTPTIQQHMN